MSKEMSKQAFEKAAWSKFSLCCEMEKDGWAAFSISPWNVHVTAEEALAAQSELDIKNQVTDEMIDAYTHAVESSHDTDITEEGLRRLRRLGLEAALKSRSHNI